jgi:glycosyltransferase involved in cell wall biosynthesis
MLVYLNARPRSGAYGGANAFLRTLVAELERRGVRTTADPSEAFDVGLLNALTEGLDLDAVRRLAERGRPLVHRKTGYLGRGSVGQRAIVGGVVLGDAQQVAFDPFVAHTIFQSRYSRDVFVAAGHRGQSSVIHNGVDEEIFNVRRRRLLRGARRRAFWRRGEPIRVVISSWSSDENKGFPEYRRIDGLLAGRGDVHVTLVGRAPADAGFRHIRVLGPRGPRRLADVLRREHVVLQLAQWETCSNALLEGLNCGLPAVYLDSGANAEIAAPYGVAYEGDLFAALEALLPRYVEIVARLPENPYRIRLVADRYLEVLEAVAAGRTPSGSETASLSEPR